MENYNKKKKIIIIGGIAAGTSAGVKARRKSEESEITIYEKDSYISYGTCGLPYYVSGKIPELDSLIINTQSGFEKRFNIKVKTSHEVLKINPVGKNILVKDLKTGNEFTEVFDKLVITTGSIPQKLNTISAEAENVFVLKTIDDAVKIKNYLNLLEEKSGNTNNTNISNGVSIVIIGGGFIGLELLEAFLLKKFNVTIIEKTSQLLPMFDTEIIDYLENYLLKLGIIIKKETGIADFKSSAGAGNKYIISSVITSDGENIKSDLVFLGIGTKPDTSLAGTAGIKTGPSGSIIVNDFMQTNFEYIYAAGDCCECENAVTGERKSFNLASIANRQGRIAGYNCSGGNDTFTDTLATSEIKVLELTLVKTGINFREARKLNQNAAKIELHYPSHASYYPGASTIHMLIIFDKSTGAILGYEAIGRNMVDKKVDILSVAIKNKMKIWELANLDLGYHPEYGAAKDSINILGMIGENLKKDEVEFIDVEDLRKKIENKEKITIIDVRSAKEYESGHIEGSVLIPIDELRQNIGRLNKNSEIIVHCRSSYRSYLAYRILKNSGFTNVKNLNGSYLSWVRKI
ncbi:MAG: FAD-dependent oxidoreductase [Actinobacteria bacterium]|nr:FAD-dependent oxidoreductase [Actinomycetota bacterium]